LDHASVDVYGQPSWKLENGSTELFVTHTGGHIAPVTYFADSSEPVRPYYISPWAEEDPPEAPEPPVLGPLRGDFFCMPFGADNRYAGENHTVHGETASSAWRHESTEKEGAVTTLTATLETTVRPARVVKAVSIVEGHNAVYQSHVISGFAGPTTLGHHATLAADTPLALNTAPLRMGITDADGAAHYADGEYYALPRETSFTDLARVPTVWRDAPTTDASVFPARRGFVDIVQVVPDYGGGIGWFTATAMEAGWLWFSLKDPVLQPTTVLWMENGGRHGAPWNGRNRCIGIEDVCGYAATGLAPSLKRNPLTDADVPTTVTLDESRPTTVNYIHGVCRIPKGFDRVTSVEISDDGVTFAASSGATATAPVDTTFIRTGRIAARNSLKK
jgi:hypothetical protein